MSMLPLVLTLVPLQQFPRTTKFIYLLIYLFPGTTHLIHTKVWKYTQATEVMTCDAPGLNLGCLFPYFKIYLFIHFQAQQEI